MDWTKVDIYKTRLSPHMMFKEYMGAVSPLYLNKRMCKPEWILAVVTVFELARQKCGEGIKVSSGVRTPQTNRGAKNSIHMINGGVAMDFKPSMGFTRSVDEYLDFYGCFVWALSQIEEHFGLGYYPKTFSGIHIDSAFTLRKDQNKSRNIEKIRGFRGYRWGQNYSFNGNEVAIQKLNIQYRMENAHVKSWVTWAQELGVNLELIKMV